MHKRRQIREAIEGALSAIGGLTVINSRLYAISALPACVIESQEESAEIINLYNSLSVTSFSYQKSFTVALAIIVEATSDLDNALDSLCKSVEIALADDPTLGGVCDYGALENTEIEFNGEGETPHAKATLSYKFIYTTPANNP